MVAPTPKPLFRTVVIAPDRPLEAQLIAALSRDHRFSLVAVFTSLSAAYSTVESNPPDLIICARDLTSEPEFPMFKALVQLIGVRLVKVNPSAGIDGALRTLGLDLPFRPRDLKQRAPLASHGPHQRLVAIGASTGGIEALSKILGDYPAECPPTVIVQHIKPDFLNSVVARLNAVCAASVIAATDGCRLQPGQVAIAPGLALHLEMDARQMRCRLLEGPPIRGHRPSVDRLFQSVALLGSEAVGVILTGMGRDGASGLAAMRRAGAWTIGQNEASSTVYGMPRVAYEEGAVCERLPLYKICSAILRAANCAPEVAT